ncbi:MAG: hypothetical protein LLG04_14235 [Parachlamydia sp.]|nr:hypothetical protein [Parachlamydia sp.]
MELAAGAVRCLERVTLSGFCQPVTVNEILKNADDMTIGLSIEHGLSSDLERVLGNVVKDNVRERLNDEFQAKQRNVPLKERLKIEFTRKVRIANGAFVGNVRQPQEYCEMNKAEEERPSWQPRLDILTKASAEEKLYSVSLIPTDPSVKQTWYEKKGWIQKELFSAQDLQAAAELFDLEELNDGPSTAEMFTFNELTSDKKEDPPHPATLYKGFVAPFAQIISIYNIYFNRRAFQR